MKAQDQAVFTVAKWSGLVCVVFFVLLFTASVGSALLLLAGGTAFASIKSHRNGRISKSHSRQMLFAAIVIGVIAVPMVGAAPVEPVSFVRASIFTLITVGFFAALVKILGSQVPEAAREIEKEL